MSPPIKSLFLSFLLISTIVHEVKSQLPPPQPNQTTIVLYLQDVAKGPSATVTPVIGIKDKDWSYNTFGTIFVVDDPVTFGSSPNSALIGRAQGTLTVSSLDGANVNVVLSILFTNSQYSGSTIEIQGVSRQHESSRELSVVSGTGKFRYARGFAVLETLFYDAPTGRSTIRLTITTNVQS
ncbi:dirigent protein 23-like [Lotus japonicus]|uniref:dirigent protein 23-like n=1 Tax=Lotus japonicus TaxID=34305 RepID=UPI0025836AB8|nr:dirigent protein 23-like [Lotus japonicus]